MKPPYEVTPIIIQLIASISEKIGQVKASLVIESSPKLRKQNRIKTIQSSLAIEGNTLTEKQITALLENKRVLGPIHEIQEVQNAIAVYQKLDSYKSTSMKSFLGAHKVLMKSLSPEAGNLRNSGVGIAKGKNITHVAPPVSQVYGLMTNLFNYLKQEKEQVLIKSAVFHYELEFIHPFIDGNGRMGRLWQTRILMDEYPIFQFLPFETLIAKSQQEYYDVLALCDSKGNSTAFIEFMLHIIDEAMLNLLKNSKSVTLTQEDRIKTFVSFGINPFTRKDYMEKFKNVSSASASRDLKKGIELGLWKKSGDKRLTVYELLKQI